MINRLTIAAALAAVTLTATAVDARPRAAQDSRERATTRQLNQQQLASSGGATAPMQSSGAMNASGEPATTATAPATGMAPETATTPMAPTTETTPPTDSTTPADPATPATPPR